MFIISGEYAISYQECRHRQYLKHGQVLAEVLREAVQREKIQCYRLWVIAERVVSNTLPDRRVYS
jgi:hypothetical protein